ncbi:MAG: LysR family transcriptional regulator [Rhizobiales bacterium]|nr:LysR family transcriptional regulator [Hyphomicrobiales bacterium]
MYSMPQRGVPPEERIDPGPFSTAPDWGNVRVFLEVVRCGSFRSAAERLGQSINGLRRRIDELESQLGTVLLTRHVDGTRLTDEGTQVFAAAERMETASFDLVRARERAGPAVSGEVRIAVTEGLGTFWLAPRLVEFQRAYPGILIDLHCAMRSADILRLEADVAIQLTRPTTPDVKVVKLGCMHVMLYASESYLRTYGKPTTYDELLKHRIVMQFADQTAAKEIYDAWFPGIPQKNFLVMRNNVSSANYWAIAKGAGIGLLPTYATAIGARVIPLDLDLRRPFDIWLTYHPDAKRIPRVRYLIDWMIEAFNPAKFPWFRDEFIHPRELPKSYRGEPLVNLFEGFIGTASN